MEHKRSDVDVKNILEELSRNGLKVGDTGDNTFAGSLCTMILQKITGKYHVASSFLDYCLVPGLKRDWEQLTSKLKDAPTFTRAMIQIYFGEWEQDSKIADIISLFAAHLDMSEEDVTNQMFCPDSVLMLGDVFHPIVPEQDYYTNPEDYMNGLMHDFEDLNLLTQFAVYFLNRSQDIIQVINSIVILEQILKTAPSFDNLDCILRSVDENNILYLLPRICIVSKTVSSTKEIDEHLKNFKERIVEALEEGLRQLLCQRRDEAKHDIKLHTCVPEDVDHGMEQMRIRIRREQSELEQEGISENNKSLLEENMKELKASAAWYQIKACLKHTLSTEKFQPDNNNFTTFEEVHTRLQELNHVREIDPVFYFEGIFLQLEPKKEMLVKLLQEKFNLNVDYDQTHKHYFIKGTVVFLSDVIHELERVDNIKSSDDFFQFHVKGSEVVYLDVDFPKKLGRSRNLVIEGRRVSVLLESNKDTVCLDVSGDDGTEIREEGNTVTAAGTDGQNGRRGNDGKSAGNIFIHAKDAFEGVEFLKILCNGGNGSRGGDGGDGGDGANGSPGKTATIPDEHPSDTLIRIWTGSEGQPGSKGGRGGVGAVGGRGGSRGSVTVFANEVQVTSLLFETQDGKGGHSGSPGNPGRSGKGGPHGKDNAWYREASWTLLHSWIRADQHSKWKDRYKDNGRDLCLVEADCSTWFRDGKTTKESVERNSGNDAPETEPTSRTPAQLDHAAPIQSSSLNLPVVNERQEPQAANLVATAERNFVLCSLELQNLEARKAKILEEIRLHHQVSVNMMETIRTSLSAPIDNSWQNQNLHQTNPLFSSSGSNSLIAGVKLNDSNLKSWYESTVEDLEKSMSRALTLAVQAMVSSSFRKWNTVPRPVKYFIPNIIQRCRTSDKFESDLIQLKRVFPAHISSISDSDLVQILQWYRSIFISNDFDISPLEDQCSRLADIGIGSILRDIILWDQKRKALNDFNESLQRIPTDSTSVDEASSVSISTEQAGLRAMIAGGYRRANQFLGQTQRREREELMTLSAEVFESTLTADLIPFFRELFSLEVERTKLPRFSNYFANIKTMDEMSSGNFKKLKTSFLNTVPGMAKSRVKSSLDQQLNIDVPLTKFLLRNLDFTPTELNEILKIVEENFKITVEGLDPTFVSSIFLDAVFAKQIKSFRARHPQMDEKAEVMLKILSSHRSHISFANREFYIKELLKGVDSTTVLSDVISNMYIGSYCKFYGEDGFEVLIGKTMMLRNNGEIKRCLSVIADKLRLDDSSAHGLPQLSNFNEGLHALDVASLDLEVCSFTISSLTEIEQIILRIEHRIYGWINWIANNYMPSNPKLSDAKRRSVLEIVKVLIVNISSEGASSFVSLAQIALGVLSDLKENVLPATGERILKNIEKLVQQCNQATPSQVWNLRADVMIEVLKLAVIMFKAQNLFNDRDAEYQFEVLVSLWRLKAGLFRVKQSLNIAWLRAAEEIRKKLADTSHVERSVEMAEEVLGLCLSCGDDSRGREFQLDLARLTFLGLTFDVSSLNDSLEELKTKIVFDLNAGQEVDMVQLLSLLRSNIEKYNTYIHSHPLYETLDLSEDFDSCVNGVSYLNIMKTEMPQEEWTSSVTFLKQFLVYMFHKKECPVENEVAAKIVKLVANKRNPQIGRLKKMLYSLKSNDMEMLQQILEQEIGLSEQSAKDFKALLGSVTSEILEGMLTCERNVAKSTRSVSPPNKSCHAKFLEHLEMLQRRKSKEYLSDVENIWFARVEQCVLNAAKFDHEKEDWILELVNSLIMDFKFEDIERLRVLLAIPCRVPMKFLCEQVRTMTEEKFESSYEIIYKLIQLFETGIMRTRRHMMTNTTAQPDIVGKIVDGMQLFPAASSAQAVGFKVSLWSSLLEENNMFTLDEEAINVIIYKVLQNYERSYVALYFNPSSVTYRHVLPRFSKISIAGITTETDLRTRLTEVLTEEEKLLFEELPVTLRGEVVDQLMRLEPCQWLSTLEDRTLVQIQSKVWGSSMSLEIKYELAYIQVLWREKFGGSSPLIKLLKNNIFPLLSLQPIPSDEFLKFFEAATDLSFAEVEEIVSSTMPRQWLLECLLKSASNAVYYHYGFNNSGSCTQIDKILQTLLTALMLHRTLLIDLFTHMKNLLQCPPTSTATFLVDFFNKILEIAQRAWESETHNVDELKYIVAEVKKCRCTAEWKRVMRLVFYKNAFPDFSDDQARKAVEIEVGIGSETQAQEFFNLVLDRFCHSEPFDLEVYERKIRHGYWVVNSQVLNQISQDTARRMSIPDHFKSYVESSPDLTGEYLVEEFFKKQNGNADMPPGTQLILDQKEVLLELKLVRICFMFKSTICGTISRPIMEFTTEDMRTWADAVRTLIRSEPNAYTQAVKLEMVAVGMRGIHLHVNGRYLPRDTQLLAVLICLLGYAAGKSQFGQIATGEGKTDISAMLAVHLALCSKNVDIMSSGCSLAIEGANSMEPFYRMFGIGAGEVSSSKCRQGPNWEQELEMQYKNSVIYGTIRCFEADFLYNKFEGRRYMGGREPDYVIVDEVDSLLLDKGSQVLFISYKIPELRYLRPFFIEIWNAVISSPTTVGQSEIEALLKQKVESKEIRIPKGLETFVEKRLKTWVKEAFGARAMEDGEYYLADGVDIVDQDIQSDVTLMDIDTGEPQLNSQYALGRQQYLQLRHGKRISPESLKAIFISNHAYLKKFEDRLFGITGTLGSLRSRQFLNKNYGVQFYEMPPHKNRRCKALEAVIVNTEDEFHVGIKNSAWPRLSFQPSLILCQTVKVARRLLEFLETTIQLEFEQSTQPRPLLLPYLTAQNVEEFEQQFVGSGRPIPPNTIIVATNLGGRGTDLKVECSGGLHVILTYIPKNKRIRNQAFGRTSRSGKGGSSAYVVMMRHLEPGWTIKDYERAAFEQEDARIAQIETAEIPKNELEGKLFEEFHERCNERSFTDLLKGWAPKIRNKFQILVKNRWAFWLDSIQKKLTGNKDEVWSYFEEFWRDVTTNCRKIRNPSRLEFDVSICQISSEFVKLGKVFEVCGLLDKARQVLIEAAEMDTYFNWIPNYYLGILLLREEKVEAGRQILKASQRSLCTYRSDLKILMSKLSVGLLTQQGRDKQRLLYLDQLSSEIEVLEPHLVEMEDLLGYSTLSPSVFLYSKHVGGYKNEAAKIFEQVKGHLPSNILKPLRVSKKVKLENGYILVGERTVGRNEVHLDTLVYEAVLSKVGDIASGEELNLKNAQMRAFDSQGFKIQTIGRIWEDLKEMGMIQNSTTTEIPQIMYNHELYESLSIEPPLRKVEIGFALNTQNTQMLLNELDLTLEEKSLLREHEILQNVTEFRGQVSLAWKQDLESGIVQLPTGISRGMVSHILQLCVNVKGHVSDTTNAEVLSLIYREVEGAQKFEIDLLVSRLLKIGILKDIKIYWPYKEFCKTQNERAEEIRNFFNAASPLRTSLSTVYDKMYRTMVNEDGAELSVNFTCAEYIDSICEAFISSAGKIKTMKKLRIEKGFTAISKRLPKGMHASEIRDLQDEHFDQLPILSQGRSMWNTGAFCLSMIALAQIAAGVTLAVATGGTALPIVRLLVSEGIGDFVFAAQAGYTGNFSWKTYGMSKACSVAISLAWGGLSVPAGATFMSVITKDIVKEAMEKFAWIVGQQLFYAAGTTAIGIFIEKMLDSLRLYCLKHFRSTVEMLLHGHEEYHAEVLSLRETLNELFETCTSRKQALDVLRESINALHGDNQSYYIASVKALAATLASIGLRKLSDGLRGGNSKLMNIASDAFRIMEMVYGLIKTSMTWQTAVPQFMVTQVKLLNQHLRQEIDTLKVKNANQLEVDGEAETLFDVQLTQPEETEVPAMERGEYINSFIDDLNKKLLDDGLEYLQKEFVEPAFKNGASSLIQASCNQAFKNLQRERLSDLHRLTDSYRKLPNRADSTLPVVTSRRRPDHSASWTDFNPYINVQRIHEIDLTVQEIFERYEDRVRLFQHDPCLGTAVAIFMIWKRRHDEREEILRQDAEQRGLRIREVLEF